MMKKYFEAEDRRTLICSYETIFKKNNDSKDKSFVHWNIRTHILSVHLYTVYTCNYMYVIYFKESRSVCFCFCNIQEFISYSIECDESCSLDQQCRSEYFYTECKYCNFVYSYKRLGGLQINYQILITFLDLICSALHYHLVNFNILLYLDLELFFLRR